METAPRRIADLNLDELRKDRKYFPSPEDWSDQALYFLLVDRFSDGDSNTPLAHPEDRGNALASEESAARWRDAGKGYVGGTLKGIESRLDYIQGLGISALWISPLLKQAAWAESYHGYATQDFLRIDPHFGSAQDLRDLVAAAHARGMCVILDVILNHAATVFEYESGGVWTGEQFNVMGWTDAQGKPSLPFVRTDPDSPDSWPGPDEAIWPVELQDPEAFHRQGSIGDWDRDPEFRDGDFFNLRDFNLGSGDIENYAPSPALEALTQAYQYWIAYADLDGFRIDTVKHMDPGAVRYFSKEIRDFASNLGKDDFFLVGEVTGGRGFALDLAEKTGLDAALEICGEPILLSEAARGSVEPEAFFDLYPEGELPQDTRTVSIIDDHDQVCRGSKARFASDPVGAKLTLASFALNVFTLGIPCIYYGSEQGFDGHGDGDDAERYIREAMFGGEFGAFGSRCVHFFDEQSPNYQGLSELLRIRSEDACLRRGRQYLRETSGDGENFAYPSHQADEPIRAIVAWSRTLEGSETVVAINTDPENETTAWVTIDGNLHQPGEQLIPIFGGGKAVQVEERNGLAVQITVPAGGVVVYR